MIGEVCRHGEALLLTKDEQPEVIFVGSDLSDLPLIPLLEEVRAQLRESDCRRGEAVRRWGSRPTRPPGDVELPALGGELEDLVTFPVNWNPAPFVPGLPIVAIVVRP